jgi:uncharacterized membrane protein
MNNDFTFGWNDESTDSRAGPEPAPQVLAIDFDDELKAREALLAALRLGKGRAIELDDAAIVTRARNGRTRIVQTKDKTPAQGAMLGAWWASLAGLVAAGLVGWLAGMALGALAGGLWARWRDVGIDDGWMKQLGRDLAPGHAAAFFQMGHVFPTNLLRELRRFDGRLLHSSLRDVESRDIEEALAFTV